MRVNAPALHPRFCGEAGVGSVGYAQLLDWLGGFGPDTVAPEVADRGSGTAARDERAVPPCGLACRVPGPRRQVRGTVLDMGSSLRGGLGHE